MTRDELIVATRQLVDEGDRLRAAPSLASLQMWLQRSDDLLATAWGSMDRYHLAWLMVGKPKGIVRGRPMTAGRGGGLRPRGGHPEDGGAADEPRSGRAPAHAVRRRDRRARQRRGECRPGRPRCMVGSARRGAHRIGLGCPPTPRSRIAWPRRAAAPTSTSGMVSAERRDRTGCSDDGPLAGSAAGHGGRRNEDRTGAGPDRPRLPVARASARPADPGTRRRLLRPGGPQGRRSTWSSSAHRRSLRDDAAALRARLPSRGRRYAASRLARRPAGRPGAPGRGARRGRASVPRARRPLLRVRAAAPTGRRVRSRRRPDRRRCCPAPGSVADRLDAWDRQFEIPGERLAGGPRPGSSSAVESARRRSSACPMAKTSG